jgi:hypothetical protein
MVVKTLKSLQKLTTQHIFKQLALKCLHIWFKTMMQSKIFAFCVVLWQKPKILQRSKHITQPHVPKVFLMGLQNNVSGTCQIYTFNYIF